MTKSELICLIEWAHTQGYPKMEEVSRDYDRLLSHPCSYEQVQSLRARIAALEAQLAEERRVRGMLVEAMGSCIYEVGQDPTSDVETWCPSCGDILRATNMKGEVRTYSHTFGCRLEAALAAAAKLEEGG